MLFAKPVTEDAAESGSPGAVNKKKASFWFTVLKVEVADIAFAVDSILAAVALAVALPASGIRNIGGLDGGQFLVIFAGGFIGLVIMRFAASFFVKLLHTRPGLEVAAFFIVGWVGLNSLLSPWPTLLWVYCPKTSHTAPGGN